MFNSQEVINFSRVVSIQISTILSHSIKHFPSDANSSGARVLIITKFSSIVSIAPKGTFGLIVLIVYGSLVRLLFKRFQFKIPCLIRSCNTKKSLERIINQFKAFLFTLFYLPWLGRWSDCAFVYAYAFGLVNIFYCYLSLFLDNFANLFGWASGDDNVCWGISCDGSIRSNDSIFTDCYA